MFRFYKKNSQQNFVKNSGDFSVLPDESALMVLQYLEPSSLTNISLTCLRFFILSKDNSLSLYNNIINNLIQYHHEHLNGFFEFLRTRQISRIKRLISDINSIKKGKIRNDDYLGYAHIFYGADHFPFGFPVCRKTYVNMYNLNPEVGNWRCPQLMGLIMRAFFRLENELIYAVHYRDDEYIKVLNEQINITLLQNLKESELKACQENVTQTLKNAEKASKKMAKADFAKLKSIFLDMDKRIKFILNTKNDKLSDNNDESSNFALNLSSRD